MDFQSIFNVVIVEPEIPHNTGNLIRLCANVKAHLHLVEPLGFKLDNPGLRRASLDYSDLTDIRVHKSIDTIFETVPTNRIYGAMTTGTVLYTTPKYQLGDTIIFGSESVGLPMHVVDKVNIENRLMIPMMPANRSLNLSNAVAIILYEMWRQIGFSGGSAPLSENRRYFS